MKTTMANSQVIPAGFFKGYTWGVDMATAGPDQAKCVVKCETCGEVLAELERFTSPDQVSLEIKEAAQVHQRETGICSGRLQTMQVGRITED